MIIVGIDPGLSGAMVQIDTDAVSHIYGALFPTSLNKKKREFNLSLLNNCFDFLIDDRSTLVSIERVHAVKGNGVSSSFSFGRSFGALEMAAHYSSSNVNYVTPQAWKKKFGLIGKGKDESRLLAKKMWPNSNLFDKVGAGQAFADAAFIALYWADLIEGKILNEQ